MSLTGTCRSCGQEVEFRENIREPGDTNTWGYWIQWRTKFTTVEAEEESGTCQDRWGGHKPVERCCWTKGNGDPCHKRIKAEDIKGKLYACGTHMRMELEEHERIAARQAAAEAEAEAAEIARWEAQVYTDAFDNVRAAFPDLDFTLRSDGRYSGGVSAKRENVASKEYGRSLNIYKTAEIDLLALQDAILQLLERTRLELQAD